MPDQELLDLAEQGSLKQDKNLSNQMQRLLADKRSWNFVENFAGGLSWIKSTELR